jgi:glutamate carboxypeptidase
MGNLTRVEQAAVEAAMAAPMLAQVEAWAAINSGSRNLDGLADVAALLGDAFAGLPGAVALIDPAPVDAVDAAGKRFDLQHGRNLHLVVRPDAPVQLLLTGHMDTVYGLDHVSDWNAWSSPACSAGRGWPT